LTNSSCKQFEKIDIPSKGVLTKRTGTVVDGRCPEVNIELNGKFSVSINDSTDFIEKLGVLIEQYRI